MNTHICDLWATGFLHNKGNKKFATSNAWIVSLII